MGGGYICEWPTGGCAASGDEDLVSGESKVGIGELGGELAERRREIGGDRGSRDGDSRFGGHGDGCSLSLRVAQREVSKQVSHC